MLRFLEEHGLGEVLVVPVSDPRTCWWTGTARAGG